MVTTKTEKIQPSSDIQSSPKKIRSSNFELLRIIAMYGIVCFHMIGNTCPSFDITKTNILVNTLFSFGGHFGNTIFFLLMGYFCYTQKFRIRKIISILAQVCFYSVLVGYILVCSGNLTILQAFKELSFPLYKGEYWFCLAYIILYSLSGFLNTVVEHSDKKQLIILILILVLLQVEIPFINHIYPESNLRLVQNEFIHIPWSFRVYLIGAFIRKYNVTVKKNHRYLLVLSTLFLVIFNVIGLRYRVVGMSENFNNLVILLLGILVFLFFKDLQIRPNRFINYVASLTLGVYLFHENGNIRSIIWNNMVKLNRFDSKIYYPVIALFMGLAVFVVGCLMDCVRKRYFEKGFWKLMDNKLIPFCSKMKSKAVGFINSHRKSAEYKNAYRQK